MGLDFDMPIYRGVAGEEKELLDIPDSLFGWKVILWNDDVHSMDYVVLVLMRCLGMDLEKATQVMLEAHHNGQSVAWAGAKETAELYQDRLLSFGLTATIEK